MEAAARAAAAVDRAGSRTSRARRGTRRDRAEATTHRERDPESEERAPRIDAEPWERGPLARIRADRRGSKECGRAARGPRAPQ